MANEIGPSLDGIDVGGGIRQDVNKVTEEAVRRVQDNQKKAKQAQQQIQQDKDQNAKFAQFLSFLLKTIKNEHLIALLYETFFKTKHPKTQMVYLRKSINTIVVTGMFAPFYPQEIEKIGIKKIFDAIAPVSSTPNIKEYLSYLKSLSKTYHDNIPIEKGTFISFLTELLVNYHIVNTEKMSPTDKEELKTTLQKELYGKISK